MNKYIHTIYNRYTGKKNKSPFCQRRKKEEKLNACAFTDEKKKILSESDRGSYFGQEKKWPDQ